MSRRYQFMIRGTTSEKQDIHAHNNVSMLEIATIDDVDKFVAEWWGEPYHKKFACPMFDNLVEVGFCCLINEGGAYISDGGTRPARLAKDYWALKEDEPARPRDHLGYLMRAKWYLNDEIKDAKFKAFMYYMFFQKYVFHAWG